MFRAKINVWVIRMNGMRFITHDFNKNKRNTIDECNAR